MISPTRYCALTVSLCGLMVTPAFAERNWEFSVAGFGGEAYQSNQDIKINSGDNGDPFHGTVHGVTLDDSGTFGAKLTAWYLPKKYDWQPQVGLELDFTRYTANRQPQLRGADGNSHDSGLPTWSSLL